MPNTEDTVVIIPPIPDNEAQRLRALYRYHILDTPPDSAFDELVRVIANICAVPIAVITLIDRDRQWAKAVCEDVPNTIQREVPRECSFCGHLLIEKDLVVIGDVREDERFRYYPQVVFDPKLRFYAAIPLVTPDGFVLGTLCVLDRVPRDLNPAQRETLAHLGRQVMNLLEMRQQLRELAALQQHTQARSNHLAAIVESAADLISTMDMAGHVIYANPVMRELIGLSDDAIAGGICYDHFVPEREIPFIDSVMIPEALTNGIWQGETVVYDRDRREVVVSEAVITHCNEAGEPQFFSAIMRDLTAQKRLEAEREEAVRTLREVAATARCLLWVADVEASGIREGEARWQVQVINPIAAQRFLPLDVPPGGTYETALYRAIIMEDRAHNDAFARAEVWAGRNYTHEFRCVDQGGIQHWLKEDVQVERVDETHFRLTGVCTDITAQKRAEHDREKTLLTLRQVINSTRCFFWTGITYPTGNLQQPLEWTTEVLDVATARAFLPIQEEPGDKYSTALARSVVQEDWERCSIFANHEISVGRDYTQDYRVTLKDGTIRWVRESVTVEVFRENVHRLTAICTDVTEQKTSEETLRLMQSAVRHASDCVVITEAEPTEWPGPRIVYTNEAYSRMTGYLPEEVLGQTPRLTQGALSDPNVLGKVRNALKTKAETTVELVNYRRDGIPYWVEFSLIPIRNDDGQHTHWLSVQRDTTARKEAEQNSLYQIYHDPLTGLPNRRLFEQQVHEAILDGEQRGRGVAVLFLDLDGFKTVNDTLGHNLGDGLLQVVAGRFLTCIDDHCTLARMGGDEFTILMTNIDVDNSFQQPTLLAERLLATFQQPIELQSNDLRITASIGISVYPGDGRDASDLLRHADIAMYRAKDRGRNGYAIFAPLASPPALDRLRLETYLRGAIENRELYLMYQPLIDLNTGEITSMESLLRWHNAQLGGWIPASTFIPMAEDTGLILALGEWVLNEAARQAAEWRKIGIHLPLTVNISAQQIIRADMPKLLAEVYARYDLPPHMISLELTEGILVQSGGPTYNTIMRFKEMGIHLLVDDFGTGYSSLSYLRRFPLDTIKIDRSFIEGVVGDFRGEAILQTIIDLAHSLSLKVVAEGVENLEQRELLRRMRCDTMQGHLVAKAVLADAIPDIVRRIRAGELHLPDSITHSS